MRCALRYDPSWGKEVFKAEKVLAHRVGHGKVTEYLVRWHGRDPATNRPWHDRWEPDENVSDDLILTYEKTQRHVCDRTVRVNAKPAYEALRRTVANAVCIDKTRAEPIVHRIFVEMLSMGQLAVPVLYMLAELGGTRSTPLEISELPGDATCEKTLVLVYTNMEQITRFCAFEHFISSDKALGAMRYDLGRTSNYEIGTVAPPLRFTINYNRLTPGIVSFEVNFPTVRFNGAYGTPEPPQLDRKHWLRSPANLGRVVAWVKAHLPHRHPLVGKGWTALPASRWELDDDDAVPA